ncbi:MAG: N-acetylmuramoyl-L-alanine amidase, partial [Clostridia bacterium]|nr:N-acetylmuramoyl-L-alanine amidase [Clostridia bacterium]
MKKFFIILSALLLLTGASALADGNPEIYLDGEKLYTESEPVNIDERVLVPMRAVFEALGADVT